MTAFILTIIVFFAGGSIGKLVFLAKQELLQRNPTHEAIDVVIYFCFIAWALLLLWTTAS